jgi:hypothetical protein
VRSKTTEVRERKIEGVFQAINDLVYFATYHKKSNLWVIKHSDLKEVLRISTLWKSGLESLSKIAQNSSTQPIDVDGTAERLKGINKEYKVVL